MTQEQWSLEWLHILGTHGVTEQILNALGAAYNSWSATTQQSLGGENEFWNYIATIGTHEIESIKSKVFGLAKVQVQTAPNGKYKFIKDKNRITPLLWRKPLQIQEETKDPEDKKIVYFPAQEDQAQEN